MPVMTGDDIIGFAIVLSAMFCVACVVGYSKLPRGLKIVIYCALVLRVVGAWLRYTILYELYRGTGDAPGYYRRGLAYAERFSQFDFSPFYDPELWFRGRWWGTSFVSFPSGITLSVIGPSFLGEFLVFSLLGFVGLVGFVVAFRRAHPDVPVVQYARWVFLFPSLWYWPSSVGKEAIVFMGLGITVAGFIGREGKSNWPLVAVGTFLVFGIRPQVAAVVILSLVMAHWLSLNSRWTLGKAVQGLLIVVVGLSAIGLAMQQIGMEGLDADNVQSYLQDMSQRSAMGGSQVESGQIGIQGIPLALMNILARPFPWEARNPMMLIATLEIVGFWSIVWLRRRNFMAAISRWRSSRFLCMAVPFILLYSITLGMAVSNLGIIARQRVFLFPFLFLLLEAVPSRTKLRLTVPSARERSPRADRLMAQPTGESS